MDLALRLSEQEASIAAAKRQQEDEAMTEALKESVRTQHSAYIVQPQPQLLPVCPSFTHCSRSGDGFGKK